MGDGNGEEIVSSLKTFLFPFFVLFRRNLFPVFTCLKVGTYQSLTY